MIRRLALHHGVLLPALLAGLMASGCVSTVRYREILDENNLLDARILALEAEVARLRAVEPPAPVRVVEKDSEAERLAAEQALLLARLRSELESDKLRIEQLRDGIHVELPQAVLFAPGSAVLGEGGVAVLRRVAAQLVGISGRVWVQGHSDNLPVGGRLKQRYPTNWELAGARAASVVRVLSDAGIPNERLAAVSRGPYHPLVSNDTAEGRARNRRIEIRLQPD